MNIEKTTVYWNKKHYPVVIQRKKIKHTYIRVKEETIAVSTNQLTPTFHIIRLVEQHKDKILRQMNKIKAQKDKPLYYLGNPIKVNWVKGKTIDYKWTAIKELTIVYKKEKGHSEALDYFIRMEARTILPLRFDACLKVFQRHYPIKKPELKLRKMKSRYGSCYYKKGKVILNTWNIQYREEIIDFIIFHELCHFIHPNHSSSFYQTLGQFVPNHKQLRKELNQQ